MNSIVYFSGIFSLTTSLILGLTLRENGWKDSKSYFYNVYNGNYTVLYGMMGASLCGIGLCLIEKQK